MKRVARLPLSGVAGLRPQRAPLLARTRGKQKKRSQVLSPYNFIQHHSLE